MKVNLIEEAFVASARVRESHRRRMRQLGVSSEALARIGRRQPPFGLQRVQEAAQGFYEPVQDGQVSVIVPVVEPSPIDFCGVGIEADEIIDLVAFQTAKPMNWRWRTGDGWALGLELLDQDAPVPLVATPLEWLAEAGRALCILDWTLAPRHWSRLRDGPPIVAENEILRRRLNAAFAANIPPLILQPAKPRKVGRHAA